MPGFRRRFYQGPNLSFEVSEDIPKLESTDQLLCKL